jgi:hypothetical protein
MMDANILPECFTPGLLPLDVEPVVRDRTSDICEGCGLLPATQLCTHGIPREWATADAVAHLCNTCHAKLHGLTPQDAPGRPVTVVFVCCAGSGCGCGQGGDAASEGLFAQYRRLPSLCVNGSAEIINTGSHHA